MQFSTSLFFLLVVFFVFLVFIYPRAASGKVALPYELSKTLFSSAERQFIAALDVAVGREYRVFGKVRIADVASVKRGLTDSVRRAALNKVAFKHFDYVVCRASDLSIIAVVELNDKSHLSKSSKQRDEFVSNVCKAIALPLFVVRAQHSYDPIALRNDLVALTKDSRL